MAPTPQQSIIRFLDGDRERFAVVEDDLAYPLDQPPWENAVPGTLSLPLERVKLLAPCNPSKVVGIGKNYRAHAKEMDGKAPDEPLIFLKPPTAVLASGEPIVRPKGYDRVDFEGELGVVIGRRAYRVTPDQALNYVFGYTCVNDVTVRDLQKRDVQFTRAKGFDTFAPLGPCIATGLVPEQLTVETRLNGVERQKAPITDMVFGVAELVSFVSRVMTLLPGDVIATGTPAGVGNMMPGDVVDVEIMGIGTLHNPVIEEE
jgi:2-keto-4-pentenoate hydratase/2-oxohepta-3-ene-1,7-dioic acid hydratase in catechol pathway